MAGESGPVDKGGQVLLTEQSTHCKISWLRSPEVKVHEFNNTLIVELTSHFCKMEYCAVLSVLWHICTVWNGFLLICTLKYGPTQIHEYTNHDSSVNSVQWAPHDFGLVR